MYKTYLVIHAIKTNFRWINRWISLSTIVQQNEVNLQLPE
jgi:hypothetical protein